MSAPTVEARRVAFAVALLLLALGLFTLGIQVWTWVQLIQRRADDLEGHVHDLDGRLDAFVALVRQSHQHTEQLTSASELDSGPPLRVDTPRPPRFPWLRKHPGAPSAAAAGVLIAAGAAGAAALLLLPEQASQTAEGHALPADPVRIPAPCTSVVTTTVTVTVATAAAPAREGVSRVVVVLPVTPATTPTTRVPSPRHSAPAAVLSRPSAPPSTSTNPSSPGPACTLLDLTCSTGGQHGVG